MSYDASRLPDSVRNQIAIGERTVVLTNWQYPNSTRNVFCFGPRGRLLWIIEESPYGPSPKKPYTGLRSTADGQVFAGNMVGIEYLIDLEDGRVTPVAPGRLW